MQEAGWRYYQDLGGSWEDKQLVPLGVRDTWVLSSDPASEVTPKSLSLSRTCPCLLYSLFVEVRPPASSQLPKGNHHHLLQRVMMVPATVLNTHDLTALSRPPWEEGVHIPSCRN